MAVAVIFFLLLACRGLPTAIGAKLSEANWKSGHDKLSLYTLLTSVPAESQVQCTAAGSRVAEAAVVAFNASRSECGLYEAPPGLAEFRRCHHLSADNQLVWFRNSKPANCWTTVQHRVSGSVDFFRFWSDYKAGFGEGPDGNYWIGQDSLHALTSGGRKLRIIMKSWNGSEVWAQYASFSVGPETDNYRLSLSSFSSSHPNLGDSLSVMSGSQFSTKDRDNDGISGINVANDYKGAWWLNSVSKSHLNGVYQNLPVALNTAYGQGLKWLDPYGAYYSLMQSEMLIQ